MNDKITMREFDRLITAHRLRGERTIAACRLVLIDGLAAIDAAEQVGIGRAAVSRALAKLRNPLCEHCGHPI